MTEIPKEYISLFLLVFTLLAKTRCFLWVLIIVFASSWTRKISKLQKASRETKMFLRDHLAGWGPKACLEPWFKTRKWSEFQSKENSVLTSRKGGLCRGRLVEISLYENDSYGCCSYIYKIQCLNNWQYYLWEVVSYQILLPFQRIYFGLIIEIMQAVKRASPFQHGGRYAEKPSPVENRWWRWVKLKRDFRV